jgi:thiamine biosynthesis lipoprotein
MRDDLTRRARPLLGTVVEVAVAPSPDKEAAIAAAFEAVARVHGLMSFHDPSSDVSRLNRSAGVDAIAVDPWTFDVLAMAVDLHSRSCGAFNVTVAPVLQSLGRLPGSSMGHRPIADAIDLLPGRCVRFRQAGVCIDLGGIAKGFAVDRAVAALRAHGIAAGLVNAGGDLKGFGPDAHTIYIRDPADPALLTGRVDVCNEALASTAGSIDPFLGRNVSDCAVIDPVSGEPVRSVRGVTVRAPSCMVADALTKVVMIAGEAAGDVLDHYGASALLVSGDGQISTTADWQDAFSLAH